MARSSRFITIFGKFLANTLHVCCTSELVAYMLHVSGQQYLTAPNPFVVGAVTFQVACNAVHCYQYQLSFADRFHFCAESDVHQHGFCHHACQKP